MLLYDDPRIAICVLGENEGWGNVFGAPVAGALMVRYLGGEGFEINPEIKTVAGTGLIWNLGFRLEFGN